MGVSVQARALEALGSPMPTSSRAFQQTSGGKLGSLVNEKPSTEAGPDQARVVAGLGDAHADHLDLQVLFGPGGCQQVERADSPTSRSSGHPSGGVAIPKAASAMVLSARLVFRLARCA